MYRISCSEVWGGIQNRDLDACSATLMTSLYSGASDGGKGGYIYYVSVCQSDMLTRVALADVVGHGEGVSHVSQWLYDCLHEQMDDGDGGRILADLNRLVTARGMEAMTTVAVVGFNRADSNAYFSYAGHYPMLLRRRVEKRWQSVPLEKRAGELANLPLGVDPNVRYAQQFIPVQSGDRAFLYTDGVIEAPAADGDLFGEERLQAVLDEHGDGSLIELKGAVLASLRAHTGGALTHDDVTLLTLEVR